MMNVVVESTPVIFAASGSVSKSSASCRARSATLATQGIMLSEIEMAEGDIWISVSIRNDIRTDTWHGTTFDIPPYSTSLPA